MNGVFMSTCLNIITRLGTEGYFLIRSVGAGRHPCEPLVITYQVPGTGVICMRGHNTSVVLSASVPRKTACVIIQISWVPRG